MQNHQLRHCKGRKRKRGRSQDRHCQALKSELTLPLRVTCSWIYSEMCIFLSNSGIQDAPNLHRNPAHLLGSTENDNVEGWRCSCLIEHLPSNRQVPGFHPQSLRKQMPMLPASTDAWGPSGQPLQQKSREELGSRNSGTTLYLPLSLFSPLGSSLWNIRYGSQNTRINNLSPQILSW